MFEGIILKVTQRFLNIKKSTFDILYFLSKQQSLYKSASLSVSESVCLFPNSSQTVNPSELKFWGMIPLVIGKVLG